MMNSDNVFLVPYYACQSQKTHKYCSWCVVYFNTRQCINLYLDALQSYISEKNYIKRLYYVVVKSCSKSCKVVNS